MPHPLALQPGEWRARGAGSPREQHGGLPGSQRGGRSLLPSQVQHPASWSRWGAHCHQPLPSSSAELGLDRPSPSALFPSGSLPAPGALGAGSNPVPQRPSASLRIAQTLASPPPDGVPSPFGSGQILTLPSFPPWTREEGTEKAAPTAPALSRHSGPGCRFGAPVGRPSRQRPPFCGLTGSGTWSEPCLSRAGRPRATSQGRTPAHPQGGRRLQVGLASAHH